MTSYFREHDGWFIPEEAARGPWDATACHAGPPTGLLARASEHAVESQPLVRITVNLIRAVPLAPFRITTEVTRAGRTVSTTHMRMIDESEREVLTAHGMHVADAADLGVVPTTPYSPPDFDRSVPSSFSSVGTAHGLPWFGNSIEVRYQDPSGDEPGPGTMWMKALPLLPDETPSPFQRICPLADCGNAISRNAPADEGFAFMNTDLTVLIHRRPVGEWFGSDAVSRWEPTGHGMSDAQLFDRSGAVGRALQTLLIRTM